MRSLKPLFIAGPCSAESEAQISEIKELALQVDFFRCGVWKPRTRSGSFEGLGEKALDWLIGIPNAMVEVAFPEQVELCLSRGINNFWIGARTTVNPFMVQELADSLRGVSATIMVKNPITPDLGLWIGALERMGAVTDKLFAIHRGFNLYRKSQTKNAPIWSIPIELKAHFPNLPIIGDPSHLVGKREGLREFSQKMLDFGFDGLMLEVHPHPNEALSDAQQQITPQEFLELKSQLNYKHQENQFEKQDLEDLRNQIDHLDEEILQLLVTRMKIVDQIKGIKDKKGMAFYQVDRWRELVAQRKKWGEALNLEDKFVEGIFSHIHKASLERQGEL
jgi:chorismate mutase